jgi:hypothetical protein
MNILLIFPGLTELFMICVCDPSPQSNNHTQSSEDINIYWSFMKDMCSPLAHLWKTCIPQLFAIVPMWKTCVPQLFAIDTFVKDMHSPAVHHWHICERHAFPRCSPFTHLSTKIIKYEVYRTEWDIFFAIVCSLLEWNQIYAGLVLLLVDIYIAVSKDGAG